MAEKVEFTVDIRSMNNDNINDITNRIRKALDKEVAEYGGSYEMDNQADHHTGTPVFRDAGLHGRRLQGKEAIHTVECQAEPDTTLWRSDRAFLPL